MEEPQPTEPQTVETQASDPLTTIPGKKEFPPYKPMAYFGGNLLLGGLSYIMLRQYKRFYIFFALLFGTAFVPIIGNMLGYVVLFGSCFDARSIAKKLKDKTLPEPEYSKIQTIIAVGLWILMILLFIGSLVLLGSMGY